MRSLRWHLSYWLTLVLPIFLLLVCALICTAVWLGGLLIYRRTVYRVLVFLGVIEFKALALGGA